MTIFFLFQSPMALLMYGLIQIVRINLGSTHIQGVLRTKVSQYAIVRPMDRRNVKISPFLTKSLQHQIDKSINRAGIAFVKQLNSRFPIIRQIDRN